MLGKFKDEADGRAVHEFIGLRPKMYSLDLGGEKNKSAAKGAQTQSTLVRSH